MSDFQDQLDQLKTAYIDALPEKIEAIDYIWQQYQSTHDTDSLDIFCRNIHSLTGSGATFGFKAISQAARALETQIKPWQDKPGALPDEAIDQLQRLLNELKRQVEDTLSSRNSQSSIESRGIIPNKAARILLAEDEENVRATLALSLESIGHTVIQAHNGEMAVKLFSQHPPDLVLMDINMPGMNGYEAAQAIKSQSSHFVPIIFLTASSETDELVRCIESGGDDFLIKSSNLNILSAKILAFQRITELHRKLEHYRDQNEEEMALAQQVFQSVLRQNRAQPVEIDQWNLAAGYFSGDILLYADCPDGGLNIFLGDFTGHGLPAAVGTLTAASIVQGMSRKGISADQILNELSHKLNEVLPTGRYCAAFFVYLNPGRDQISVWNCGLPDALMISADGDAIQTLPSQHLPLGIVANSMQTAEGKTLSVDGSASLLIMSDGITEASDPQGQLFGNERLLEVAAEATDNHDAFALIKKAVLDHMGNQAPTDDISLMSINLGVCRV